MRSAPASAMTTLFSCWLTWVMGWVKLLVEGQEGGERAQRDSRRQTPLHAPGSAADHGAEHVAACCPAGR